MEEDVFTRERNSTKEEGVFIQYTLVVDSFVPLHNLKKKYGQGKSVLEMATITMRDVEDRYKDHDEQEIRLLDGTRVLVKKLTGCIVKGPTKRR